MTRNLLAAVAAGLLLSACSAAGDGERNAAFDAEEHDRLMAIHHSIDKMGASFFRMMDADKDGIVTREERETLAYRKWFTAFSKVDLDGDGRLTEQEYIKALRLSHPTTGGQEV